MVHCQARVRSEDGGGVGVGGVAQGLGGWLCSDHALHFASANSEGAGKLAHAHGGERGGYWAPLTRKRHIPPHSAQPRHTSYWAPRTRKRHQQEHRPQRPTERSDPTQHAKGRTGDRPGPRKGATTRRNVTQGAQMSIPSPPPPRLQEQPRQGYDPASLSKRVQPLGTPSCAAARLYPHVWGPRHPWEPELANRRRHAPRR